MKKIILPLAVLSLVLISNAANAQSQKQKEIRKEVNIEENNGEKVITIQTTDENGTRSEVYRGDEADEKIAEYKNKKSGSSKTVFIGEDGKKHMKIEKRVMTKKEVGKDK